MKSPEEEADHELGKRLREKFAGYKVSGKDRVRKPVFSALDKSPKRFYWIPVSGILLLIALFLLFKQVEVPVDFMSGKGHVAGKIKNEHDHVTQQIPDPKNIPNKAVVTKLEEAVIASGYVSQEKEKKNTAPIHGLGVFKKQKKSSTTVFSSSIRASGINHNIDVEHPFTEKADVNTNYQPGNHLIAASGGMELLSPIDSINIPVSITAFTIPSISSSAVVGSIEKPNDRYRIKGIFSASIMQTFQLVHLSPSADDRIQNLKFAPLLSSRALSYKLTAGIERKNTQLALSYTYFRNRHEYEMGTNQVIATRTNGQQYQMSIVGEKHWEDERSHLLGVGIRQRFIVPRHILKNYSINLGAEYTRLLPKGQDLFWGNIGFFKNIYTTGGARIDIGPYIQYSFTERQVAKQTWTSRPYQVGIWLGVKMK